MFGKIQSYKNHGKKDIVLLQKYLIAVMVHGWLFRVETGFIEELEVEESIP